jgi:hypothetical protein
MIAKLLALMALLAVYANNIFHSESPLFAFFYQPNFIIMLIILFIIGTFFKIIKTLFGLALVLGLVFYGYSYFTGSSPLEKLTPQTTNQVQNEDKCGPETSWYKKLSNHCY